MKGRDRELKEPSHLKAVETRKGERDSRMIKGPESEQDRDLKGVHAGRD